MGQCASLARHENLSASSPYGNEDQPIECEEIFIEDVLNEMKAIIEGEGISQDD